MNKNNYAVVSFNTSSRTIDTKKYIEYFSTKKRRWKKRDIGLIVGIVRV